MEETDRPMSPLTKVVFWFVAANASVGAVSLIFFPADTARLFFWEINPPINAALFGALYLGGAAVVALVTYRGRWEPARFLIPVLVSAGALITVTTLLHLDRFSAGPRFVYWLVIYIGAPLLPALLRTARAFRGSEVDGHPAADPSYPYPRRRGGCCTGRARNSRLDLARAGRGAVALAHYPAHGPDFCFMV